MTWRGAAWRDVAQVVRTDRTALTKQLTKQLVLKPDWLKINAALQRSPAHELVVPLSVEMQQLWCARRMLSLVSLHKCVTALYIGRVVPLSVEMQQLWCVRAPYGIGYQ